MSFLIRQLGKSRPLFPSLYHCPQLICLPNSSKKNLLTLSLSLLISQRCPSDLRRESYFLLEASKAPNFLHLSMSPASSFSTHLSRVLPTWSSGLESWILVWWLEAWTLRPNAPAEGCMILSKLLNLLISFISKTRTILVPTSGLSSRLWELK